MKKESSAEQVADDYKKAVKRLQKARDKVGKRLGRKAGIMVSTSHIALKDEIDLYNVLDDLLKQVAKNRP
jgi:hypothetical protein